MHELGIANAVVDTIHLEQARYPQARVRKVGVRLGEFSGVNGDALRFCFDVIVRDTNLAGAALEIEPAARDELELSYLELEEP